MPGEGWRFHAVKRTPLTHVRLCMCAYPHNTSVATCEAEGVFFTGVKQFYKDSRFKKAPAAFRNHPVLRNVSAVRNGRVYRMPKFTGTPDAPEVHLVLM